MLFLKYLKYRLFYIVLLLICAVCSVCVFYLYEFYLEAVVYACILSTAVVLGFGTADFIKFRRKHLHIKLLEKNPLLAHEHLPLAIGLIEQDYAELIRKIALCMQEKDDESEKARNQMSDYYTMWVHQIKTPISAMDLILQGSESETSDELKIQLFRISQYADMVLAYLRTDDKGSDFLFANYGLDGIVRQAVRKYAFIFIKKHLTLDVQDIDLTVLTDEKWLVFVIEQLISNAVKYTHSGGVTIYAEGRCLCIKDTGIGIATEDLPRICERGFTGVNGRIDKHASGIGLYLVNMILKKLGHSIVFDSTLGEGTTARIYFPTRDFLPYE